MPWKRAHSVNSIQSIDSVGSQLVPSLVRMRSTPVGRQSSLKGLSRQSTYSLYSGRFQFNEIRGSLYVRSNSDKFHVNLE